MRLAGPRLLLALLLAVRLGYTLAQEPPLPVPASPPAIPPPSPPAPPSNTTISFFNAGSCSQVPSAKFSFPDEPRSGSAGELSCPDSLRVTGSSTPTCEVPGPYGREIFVTLSGAVPYLDITILNPADDDAVIAPATRIYLSTTQRRNHIGAVIRVGTPAASCSNNFQVIRLASSSAPIAPGYFRSIFHHAAIGVGSAELFSNGDSNIATLAHGESLTIDQRLITAADVPSPVVISYQTQAGSGATSVPTHPEDPARERLWGSTCEMASTAFVLFGSLPDDLQLQVLRLDGAGIDVCSYTEAETGKIEAELALYNAVSTPSSYLFAFGVSPFLPYAALSKSASLAYQSRVSYNTRQPGEVWLKVIDSSTGQVRVLSQRVVVHAQARNVIGVSLSGNDELRISQLQPRTDSASVVAPSHFRMIFAHASLSMPPATILANDDVELLTVPPGGYASMDHPLLPPNQAGQLLKVSFAMPGVSASTHVLLDLSTLCDGAAYAMVLVGTLSHVDAYDATVMQVGGTDTACQLPSSVVSSGASSSLALINAAAVPQRVRFQWGKTLLSLNYQSVPLAFGAAATTDVGVGEIFVRLRRPDPPYEPLSPISTVRIQRQSRNVLLARDRPPVNVSTSHVWSLTDAGAGREQIAPLTLNMIVFNALEDGVGAAIGAGVTLSGAISTTVILSADSSAAFAVDADDTRGVGLRFFYPSDPTVTLASAQLEGATACAQSMVIVTLCGRRGATAEGAFVPTPRAVHVDVAAGYCRLIVPFIPERLDPPAPTYSPPSTVATLDIFGEDGPGDGGLFGAAPARHRAPWLAWWLVVGATGAVLRGARTAVGGGINLSS